MHEGQRVDFLNPEYSKEYRHASGKIRGCSFFCAVFETRDTLFLLTSLARLHHSSNLAQKGRGKDQRLHLKTWGSLNLKHCFCKYQKVCVTFFDKKTARRDNSPLPSCSYQKESTHLRQKVWSNTKGNIHFYFSFSWAIYKWHTKMFYILCNMSLSHKYESQRNTRKLLTQHAVTMTTRQNHLAWSLAIPHNTEIQ